jgi:membrane protein DedA with SNARE-associated domain
VSAAAVVAAHESLPSLLTVVAAGAVGAYLGDGVTYAALRWGGDGAVRRMPWLRRDGVPQRTADRLAANPVPVLLVSRLLPGGRVPVLLAAALFGVPWRQFAVANLFASLLWSTAYASVGLAGRAVFPEPWQGIVAVVTAVLLVSLVGGWLSRRRND